MIYRGAMMGLITCFLIIAILFTFNNNLSAAGYNDYISLQPYIIDGQEMFQLKELADQYQWFLGYNAESRSIYINTRGEQLSFSLEEGVIDGNPLPVAPVIYQGRTYLDIEAVGTVLQAVLTEDPPSMIGGLYTDNDSYSEGEIITAHLRLYNISQESVFLNFGSGQSYDLALLQGDEEVWRWSEGRFFTMALIRRELEAGNKLLYDVEIEEEINHGEYTLVGEIATVENRLVLNQLGIDVNAE